MDSWENSYKFCLQSSSIFSFFFFCALEEWCWSYSSCFWISFSFSLSGMMTDCEEPHDFNVSKREKRMTAHCSCDKLLPQTHRQPSPAA